MRVLRFLLALMLMACLTDAAFAADGDKRIALVIGIGSYKYAPELPNPPNDARAIGAALRKLDFEVQEVFDLDNRAFASHLRDFGVRASAADVAVVFYAGHGLQVRGQNYLLPSDARLERERDLVYEAMPLNLIMGELAQARKLGVLILDACRNNPFADRLSRSNAGAIRERDVSAGLARIDDTPSDTLVALATRADALAEDGSGDHSPYTDALLKNFDVPGLELGLFFRRVRDNVMEATQGRQEPFIFGSLGATPFYFNPAPPNRNPEIPPLKPVTVADTADQVKLGIGKIVDPDGDEVFAQISGLPRSGQVRVGDRIVLIGDYLNVSQLAQVTFKPEPGGIGAIGSFDFNVLENRGGHASGSIPITVTQSNRPPVVAGERTLRVAVSQLGLEAPNDPDGDPLTMTVAGLPSAGKVRKGTQPLKMGEKLTPADFAGLTYDPEQSAPGNAGNFAVLIDDGKGGKATASVKIEVAPPGAAPSGPDLDDAMWQRVRTGGQPADFTAYLQLFPSGRNAPLARERLAALGPVPSPTITAQTAPAAPAKQETKKPEPSTDGNRKGRTTQAGAGQARGEEAGAAQGGGRQAASHGTSARDPAGCRRRSLGGGTSRDPQPRDEQQLPGLPGMPGHGPAAVRRLHHGRAARRPQRAAGAQGHARPVLRARHVRGDRGRMARLRSGRRLHRHAAHGRLGHRPDARPQRPLERRRRLCHVAVQADGAEVPAADGSGVGIRRARRHRRAVLVGGNRRRRQCQLRELRRYL